MRIQDTSDITVADLVPLADVKDYLRVDGTDEDDLIGDLMDAACAQVQDMTNTRIKTVQAYGFLEGFFNSDFPVGQVNSVTAVHYKASGDTYTELDSSKWYTRLTGTPARIQFVNYPSLEPDALHRVRITFSYGYDDSAFLRPKQYAMSIKMLVAHMYDNRLPAVVGRSIGTVPLHVESLISTFRHL